MACTMSSSPFTTPWQLATNLPITMAPRLLSLLLLLVIPSLAISQEEGFWSIDCGGTGSFTYEDTNIAWVGDGDFVKTGESETVPGSGGMWRELRTLRVFKSSEVKKSCYSIPVGVGAKILVRARFYYGNYDGLGNPPEFRLMFDTEIWDTVTTTMDTTWRYEVVYVTKSSSTSICVGRITEDHHPFISALEVRTLAMNTYGLADPARPMYSMTNNAFGTLNMTRYPDDKYDRIWDVADTTGYTVLNSSAAKIATGINDAPPEKILRAAISPGKRARNLTVWTSDLPSDDVPMYYTLYFSEVANLSSSNATRSFDIYLDGELLSNASKPMVPPFGGVLELFGKTKASNNNTVFEFVPTANSTLPPLLNAMEVFWISDPMKNGTASTDVGGLSVLQVKFEVLQKWSGDPCLPENYSWEWVRCDISDSGFARVTELQLGGYNLSGTLPDFSALSALQIIDLQDNNLSGEVPDFLGDLPSLKELNLSNNDISKIPSTLLENSSIDLIYDGNPRLCQPGKTCGGGAGGGAAPSPSVPVPSAVKSRTSPAPLLLAVHCMLALVCGFV